MSNSPVFASKMQFSMYNMYPLFASYFWLIYLSASVLTAEGKVLLLNWTYCDWSVFVCETEVRNLSTSQRSYYSSLQCNFDELTGSLLTSWLRLLASRLRLLASWSRLLASWSRLLASWLRLLASSSSFLLKLKRSKEVPNKREDSSYFGFSPSFSLSSLLAERDWITVEKRVEEEGHGCNHLVAKNLKNLGLWFIIISVDQPWHHMNYFCPSSTFQN